MKLWYSFIKELKIASRGFYFYVEIFMAILILAVLLFVVPETFENKETQYIYLDLPTEIEETFLKEIKNNDLDGKAERVNIKIGDETIQSKRYESADSKVNILNSKEDVVALADKKRQIGAVVTIDESGNIAYEYYLQGYEAQRLKNLLSIVNVGDSETFGNTMDQQEVRSLTKNKEILTDRENIIPVFLTFNGSLMGLFIIAAYIFLDKQEGVIKAYAVTASSVWQYLMSKIGVVLVTSILSSFIVLMPIVGFQPNYGLLLIFLLTTGFFASSLGLLIASYYKNIVQAFGAIYLFMMAMIIPSIAYFIPSWNPSWIKVLPTYPMLQGFKEILLKQGDTNYVLMVSGVFLILGVILFGISNMRYKKTLTV